MPPFTSPTFETAKARVEAGDLSFEALSALTVAHGELLVATDHLDRRDPRESDPTKAGIFRDHRCWKCNDGKKPCAEGSPNLCGYPHARND